MNFVMSGQLHCAPHQLRACLHKERKATGGGGKCEPNRFLGAETSTFLPKSLCLSSPTEKALTEQILVSLSHLSAFIATGSQSHFILYPTDQRYPIRLTHYRTRYAYFTITVYWNSPSRLPIVSRGTTISVTSYYANR